MRAILVSPLADAVVGRYARRFVPRMEADVRALGSAFGEHSVANTSFDERTVS
jgi:hypothetical protein